MDVVDIPELASAVAEQLNVLAEEKSQSVRVRCDSVPLWFGDRMVLRQAMLNLLDNAIKYTPDGGTIEVHVSQEPMATTIDVVDSGPGIPFELQPRIFDRFYRVDKSRSRENGGGTGLGLAIAKWAVEVNGGRLTLEPAPSGSRFRISLPETVPNEGTADCRRSL